MHDGHVAWLIRERDTTVDVAGGFGVDAAKHDEEGRQVPKRLLSTAALDVHSTSTRKRNDPRGTGRVRIWSGWQSEHHQRYSRHEALHLHPRQLQVQRYLDVHLRRVGMTRQFFLMKVPGISYSALRADSFLRVT